MCGIWGILQTKPFTVSAKSAYYHAFTNLQLRGPDKSSFHEVNNYKVPFILGFHRLAIMGPDSRGDQPFAIETDTRAVYVTCNGEIYGFKKLIEKYKLPVRSNSDCEIIPLIYWKYGLDTLLKDINEGPSIFSMGVSSEFAMSIVDINKVTGTTQVYLVRDPCGVRPLYYYHDPTHIVWSSLLKGFVVDGKVIEGVTEYANVKQLPGGKYAHFTISQQPDASLSITFKLETHYFFDFPAIERTDNYNNVLISSYFQNMCSNIRSQLEQSVVSMLDSDRPLGALLSGGLDSSLIVAIAAAHLKKDKKILNTFSIGMPGSTDKMWAEKVAAHCGTNHTHIELTNEQFLEAVPHVVKTIESYDITTVRASTGQYLVSQWISKNTPIKVLLVGDGSDELTGGYKYFHKAPSAKALHEENCRLLQEIWEFDVLRVDRCVSNFGLEARVPFLTGSFIQTYMECPAPFRMPKNGVEKWLLRKSFEGTGLLPNDVLYRSKEAFSDGVSSEKQSWHDLLRLKIDDMYSLYTYQTKNTYTHCKPISKEALYYRELFREYFGQELDHIVSHYWLPKWCGTVTDPSARVLPVYKQTHTQTQPDKVNNL